MTDDPRKLAQDALTRANDTPPGAYAPQYWHDVPALAHKLLEALDRVAELEAWVKATSPWKDEEK